MANSAAGRKHGTQPGYARNARFVFDLGAEVLDLLAPKPEETILDLGCGDDALTERIAADLGRSRATMILTLAARSNLGHDALMHRARLGAHDAHLPQLAAAWIGACRKIALERDRDVPQRLPREICA